MFDLQAEQAVLGAIMFNNGALPSILSILEVWDFYDSRHQLIYHEAKSLYDEGEPVDLVTMASNLNAIGKLEEVGGNIYLMDLSEMTGHGYQSHARIVKDWSEKRDLQQIGVGLADSKFLEGVDKTKQEILDKILSLDNSRFGKYQESESVMNDTMDHVDVLLERGEDLTGIPSGFPRLDAITFGFQPSDLVILAARPSMGKTALGLSFMLEAARSGVPVGFVSIEMAQKQLGLRLLAMESGVEAWKIKKGFLKNRDDYNSVLSAKKVLGDMPFHIDSSPKQGIYDISSRAKMLTNKHDIGLIIVDYLQFIEEPDPKKNTNYNMGQISRNLKMVAKELNIPIIALAQLSRECEKRTDKRPVLSDLRDSGNIEQDADIVIMLYREAQYKDDDSTETELLIRKHRNGETGMVRIQFDKETVSFKSGS